MEILKPWLAITNELVARTKYGISFWTCDDQSRQKYRIDISEEYIAENGGPQNVNEMVSYMQNSIETFKALAEEKWLRNEIEEVGGWFIGPKGKMIRRKRILIA